MQWPRRRPIATIRSRRTTLGSWGARGSALRFGERLGGAELVAQLGQEKGPGVGDDRLAVRRDFYGLRRRSVSSPSGCPPWVVGNGSPTAFSRPQEDVRDGLPGRYWWIRVRRYA